MKQFQFSRLLMGWAVLSASLAVQAQVTTTVDCDLMGLVVNVGSDSNSVNLYHPGGYLTFPPEHNVMAWEFTDSQGNLIEEVVTENENFIHVVHNLPVTDTLFVSVLLTNDSAFHNGLPVACLIEDYLFWEVDTWPNSGEEYGTWTLGGSVGQDVSETSELEEWMTPEYAWNMFPQPTSDWLSFTGLPRAGTVTLLDLSGKTRFHLPVVAPSQVLDLSGLSTGLYLVQVSNARGEVLGTQHVSVVK